ncbi:MAG: sigma-E factor negative regulatory protein [Gammaproteobacteria bacterium]|nr:sigma-E factor negative regulatory protein [Gammaproteobacteria bacterium]
MSIETEISEKDLELISASIDEDLSEFERRRLNSSVLAKPEGEKTWVRYNAVSAIMNKHFPAQIDNDFSQQVMQAISKEGYEQEQESPAKASIKRVGSYVKQVAGLAVAASVAAFSIVTYQNFNQPTAVDIPEVAISQQEAADEMMPAESIAINDSQQVEFAPATVQQLEAIQSNPQVEEKVYYQELNPYIQGHAGYGSQRIISPYVEIIELKDVKE